MVMKKHPFSILRIEVPAHYKGGSPIKPWVATIDGIHPKWGLSRSFITPMNDWSNAHSAWSGNLYGVVATWLLRENVLYEIRSGPHQRQFARFENGKSTSVEPLQALRVADGGGDAAVLKVVENVLDRPWVRDVSAAQRNGFVLDDGVRIYRLRDGHRYRVYEGSSERMVVVRGAQIDRIHG